MLRRTGGEAESRWLQNICQECGWEGQKYFAWQDYQYHLLKDEASKHKCGIRAKGDTR